MAAARQLWHSYRRGAEKRGYVFEISFERFCLLTKQNCKYCGVEPNNLTKSVTTYKYGQYLHNGIDRANNYLGYTKENCVPCCKICNTAKKNFTLEEFEAWIERLVRFQSPK
jgi:hypothetical protein